MVDYPLGFHPLSCYPVSQAILNDKREFRSNQQKQRPSNKKMDKDLLKTRNENARESLFF